MRRVLAAVALAALLAGCSAPEQAAPASEAPVAASSAPVSLTFSDVGVDNAPLAPTGLNDRGEIDVPPVERPEVVEYLRWSPRLAPGRPLVVVAHVSGRDAAQQAIPGAFADLDKAEEGDEFSIKDASGASSEWVVREVKAVPKTAFPTDLVYDPRPVPTVVLVTCGGDLDRAARSFRDNILVFAEPA